MRPQVNLFLKPLSTVNLSTDQLYSLSSFPQEKGEAIYITSAEGTLLVQSISHYLVNIQLYEYKIHNHSVIDLEVTEPSFFMTAMLEGCSVLYDENANVISEVSGNACKLTYLNAGNYQRSLLSGDHTILLLTIRPEWLINKYGALDEFRELIAHYTSGSGERFSLPNFSIAQQIFNALRKLNTKPKGKDHDINMHIFINDCIRRYLVKLHTKITNAEYQMNKGKEIGQFIVENFASRIVDDEPALAKHFMISTITLTRLAKLHFGRPLHKHVIELRVHNGLKLILSTNKTIQEIAGLVGYDDPKYFNKAFKKRFGITPNGIRVCVL
jgi:AraC-like DNA-binding protein